MLWSDRFWTLRLALALVVFAAVGHLGARHLSRTRASLEAVRTAPDRLEGLDVSFWGRRVTAVGDDGFEVATRHGPVRILTPRLRPEVGAYVSGRGRLAGPATVAAVSERVNEGFAWKRPLAYAVSAFVVAGFLWSLRRRFRTDLALGAFRSRA